VPVKDLTGGDALLTERGEWVRVEEVFDTGEWEEVYNLRVADFHTYFVGDEHWGFAAWAHNAYSWTVSSTHDAGTYNTVSDSNGYSRPWWKPKSNTPPARLQSDPCKDKSTGLGDRLRTSAQALADGWKNQTEQNRYGSRLDSTIRGLLLDINAFLRDDGKPELSLSDIDIGGQRFPALSTSIGAYTNTIRQFWFHRSVSIGWYVHTKLEAEYRNEPGLTYNGGVGPDFNYTFTTPEGSRTIYFEVLPDTAPGRAAHAKRGMNTYLYRAVYYNRNAINNGGSSDEKVQIPNEF
jgi:hypothetical protein